MLPNNIFYSPLAGCSDYAYRDVILGPHRPGLFFCEMVKMDALIRHDENTYHLLDYHRKMHPIGAQLCGSNPKIAGAAAKIIEDLGFDVIDLNCGCPVDKVTKDGSGSGLLKSPKLIGEILSNMIAAVNIPVTVKIRMGWDASAIIAPEITQIAESAGAKAIAIHGRTRQQGYKGPADWQPIKESVDIAKNIQVIGNGDVFCGQGAEKLFATTGCHAALVSRGTLGRPWICEEIVHYLQTGQTLKISPEKVKQKLIEHIQSICSYYSPHKALLHIRKVGCWYLREMQGSKSLRLAINHAASVQEVFEMINAYSWEGLE